MIQSMTGFASQSSDVGDIRLHLELRSVNSRYLDLGFRIGDELRQAEPMLRERISARVGRGKLECRLNLHTVHDKGRSLAINAALLEQLASVQTTLRERFVDAAPLSMHELLRWPGILADDSPGFDELLPALRSLVDAALEELIATRQREGAKLVQAILERASQMRQLLRQVAPRMPEVVAAYQQRLSTRLREVVASLDEDRIRQELALYAQRIDVDEELTRLNTHLDELERILKGSGAAGKRLDFLMQELNREANTLASKSPAPDITAVAMELKVLIEQMREQVQNLE